MPKIKNLERLLKSTDLNGSIIKLDDFIVKACAYGNKLDILTEPQRQFYFNQNLEREINNGGFSQFFFNSSGNFAMETLQSLKAIGAMHTVKILQEAIDQFPGGKVPKDWTERQELMEKIEEKADKKWGELDELFFEYNDSLSVLNMNYIKANSSSF